MTKRNFLSGVGIVALSGALVASPAYASEGDAENVAAEDAAADSYRLPVIAGPETRTVTPRVMSPVSVDSFAGFDETTFTSAFEATIDLSIGRYDGSIRSDSPSIEPRIITRDDVDPNGPGVVDFNETQPSVVQMFFRDNTTGDVFLNCTGSLINPRTVLTAAHCVNSSSSEAYGTADTAPSSILIGTGFDTQDRLFATIIEGATYSQGGVATSTDVVIHSSSNLDEVGLPFPWADIALIAVDEPITDIPTLDILLTPLTELTHVVQVGYGTFGDAFGGGTNGSPFLRRVGENMLGAVASLADLNDAIFPVGAPSGSIGNPTQAYYFTDFDWPDRDALGFAGQCQFPGNTISCQNLGGIIAIDYFDGDALPNEVATAPGDSGSPLIVDQLYDRPVAAAVLSGGVTFFRSFLEANGFFNTYADISFYNPLYPFFEFITENTAYKYVSALEGDGVWSDPTRWTQDLDPGFFIDDGSGNLVNGIPEGSEPGIYAQGPKLGTIVGTDISGFADTDILPPDGLFFGIGSLTPESSVLLGPGSTGFVPQNTDGTPGTSFANPAQYFEVHLTRAGTTTVDLDVEIDKLIIDNSDAGFVLPTTWDFTSIIGVEQFAGVAEINGTLNTGIYTLAGGQLTGDGGTINTNVMFNLEGLLNAGGFDSFGSLTIDGDYVQTSGGALWSDFSVGRRNVVTADSYDVSGVAVLDGTLVVATNDRRVRFGSEYTVLSAGEIDGTFGTTVFLSSSPILTANHRVEGNEVIVKIGARSIRDILGARSSMSSLGSALDALRASNFDGFANMFGIIDSATFDTLGSTLSSLTPVSAFSQTFTANSFSQRFTGQIAQRTLALRGGSLAAGGFSAAGNASFAIAGTTPSQPGRLGVFGTASGVYLNGGQQVGVLGSGAVGFDTFGINGVSSGVIGANAFEQASLTQAGEMTIGADLQVTEGFSFGIAVSNIQNSELSTSALQAQADRSQSVAIYATWASDGLFADGYAGTANQQFGVERAAQGDFRSSYTNAIGQADGQQTFGGMRLGYAFDLAKGFEVGPVVSMDYVRNSIGGYDELGAGSFGLSVADRTFTSMGAKAGAMASFDIRTGETSSIRAFGSVAYARELADTSDVVTAHFFGAADTPFTIANELDPQWVSVNAGAEMAVGNNLRASFSVTSDMGRGALSNDQGRVSISWQF